MMLLSDLRRFIGLIKPNLIGTRPCPKLVTFHYFVAYECDGVLQNAELTTTERVLGLDDVRAFEAILREHHRGLDDRGPRIRVVNFICTKVSSQLD